MIHRRLETRLAFTQCNDLRPTPKILPRDEVRGNRIVAPFVFLVEPLFPTKEVRMKIGMTCALMLLGVVQAIADETPRKEPSVLERKLIGEWEGGACMGDYTFYADGTFDIVRYSPGGNILTGTWSLGGDAVPATLALTYKTSDFKRRYRDGSEFRYLGKTLELKVTELTDESFSFQFPDRESLIQHTRAEMPEVRELAALQGSWVPLQSEEHGHQGYPNRSQLIKDDKITVQWNDETRAEGKVVLDPTKNPKQMDIQLASGEAELLIYVRTNDYVIACGNRDGKTRPTEFATGTVKGGDYLFAWKIKR